jgi:PAS domain S-box-containing protein
VADGVICTDVSGSIILINKAAEEIFGYNADELVGEKVELLMPRRHRTSHQMEVHNFATTSSRANRAMGHGRDVVGLKKNGDEFLVEASLTLHSLAGRRVLTVVLRDISERRVYEGKLRLVTSEMVHRFRNLITVVNSIVSLTARGAETVHSFEEVLRNRLRAVARTVDLMIPAQWTGANLTDLLETELAPYRSQRRGNIVVSGPDVQVPARWAVLLALALHELATNAAKYGALSTPGGFVNVTWRVDQAAASSVLCLKWMESGGPAVQPASRQGFGSELIARALGRSKTHITYHESGLEAQLEVAL